MSERDSGCKVTIQPVQQNLVPVTSEEPRVSEGVEASPVSISPLILEAVGSIGALTRARRNWMLVKNLGTVPVGSEEDVIIIFAEQLVSLQLSVLARLGVGFFLSP